MPRLPTPLPPGIVEDVFTYADGTSVPIYRSPVQSQGPMTAVDRNGDRFLAFMYHFFVFSWPANACVVDIRHGRLPVRRAANVLICRGVPLRGEWCPETLRQFATEWVGIRNHEISLDRRCGQR